MSGVPEFSRGNAPDPLAYTPARAALIDRLDATISSRAAAAGFDWTRCTPRLFRRAVQLTSLEDLCNITGQGLAYLGGRTSSGSSAGNARIVITRDGGLLEDSGSIAFIQQGALYGTVSFPFGDTVNLPTTQWGRLGDGPHFNAVTSLLWAAPIGFRTSLRIQVAGDGSANTTFYVAVLTQG